MNLELNLRFPRPDCLIVRLGRDETPTLIFSSPLAARDHEELRWYLETYASHYTTDADDLEAARIEAKLPILGESLFAAAFSDPVAQRLFYGFQDHEEDGRLLTISAEHPGILSLPWELLRDPRGVYLFNENPRISVRRRIAGAAGGRPPFKLKRKGRINLLFVVSRPENAGFIDPRSESLAVMEALEHNAPDKVTFEFLRPPSLDHLVDRLENSLLPPVDILHFDGHGFFDTTGCSHQDGHQSGIRIKRSPGEPVRATEVETGANVGYLLFEDGQHKSDPVSAELLGEMLQRQRVNLVVLSACQSAAFSESGEPMGSIAARLTSGGIPSVLAMSHAVLVATTEMLFGHLYKHLANGERVGAALDNARRFLMRHPERHELQRGPRRVRLKLQDWFLPALYQEGNDLSC